MAVFASIIFAFDIGVVVPDLDAATWLAGLNAVVALTATKVDKLSRAERDRNLKTLETMFGMPALPVSAESGEGMDELWRTIARLARPGA